MFYNQTRGMLACLLRRNFQNCKWRCKNNIVTHSHRLSDFHTLRKELLIQRATSSSSLTSSSHIGNRYFCLSPSKGNFVRQKYTMNFYTDYRNLTGSTCINNISSLPISYQNQKRWFSSQSDDKNNFDVDSSKPQEPADAEAKKLISEMLGDFGVDSDTLQMSKLDPAISGNSEPRQETSDSESSLESSDSESSDSDADKMVEDTLKASEVEEFEYEDLYAREKEYEYEVYERDHPISLTRGKRGVFDIEDLVALLQDDNAQDLCVISVPPENRFVDYLVIASGTSTRHIKAMSEYVKWLYKRRSSKKDPTVRIEGLETSDWMAMDLGNIALHLFLPEAREQYNLETLWTVGEAFDEQSQITEDPFADAAMQLDFIEKNFSFDNLETTPTDLGQRPSWIGGEADFGYDDQLRKKQNKYSGKDGSMENTAGWHGTLDKDPRYDS